LSTGTIDRCIREAGIACVPVVEELVEQLQQAHLLHLDETHWYESGKLHWLWVAVTTQTAVFHIGSRRKEELSHLVRACWINPEIRSDQGLTPLKGYLKAQKWGKIKQNHCTSLRTTQSNVSKVTAELDK
jgi:hypothetical protein